MTRERARQNLDEVRKMSPEQVEMEIRKAGLKPMVDAMAKITLRGNVIPS